MKRRKTLLAGLGIVPLAVAGALALAQDGRPLNAERIEAAAGTKATTAKDGVVRLAWPRTDVPVRVDGVPL